MKRLLLLLLIALCGIAWRSADVMEALGLAQAQAPAATLVPLSGGARPMSLHEYAELAKSDPEAYRKLIDSMRAPQERSEVDKLMNFFARGKYE